MKMSTLTVLSADEIRLIHNASLDILSDCGVHVPNSRMLSFMERKGLAVDRERQRIHFSRSSVEDALAQVPARFEVCDRSGKPAFLLGDGQTRFAAGHNAVFWVDSESGKTRKSTVADVEAFARICDRLECVDMIGIPVMPQDVPHPKTSLLHGVRAVITQSRKPIFFSTDNPRVNRVCIELLEAVFAGDMTEQVYGICQLSSTAPLSWEEGVLDALMDAVETGIPLAILPEPNAGVSAPYTLAGLVTENNVEWLSGLVMAQLVKPGSKILYANSWTTTDMRSGAALVGSTETSICRVAGAQMARFYKTPSHTTAPNSDNHAHDEQNAWEKTFSTFCSVAAGNDLIVNLGMFATGMTCSHEQLIMDEEICAMSRRLTAGLNVTEETIAKDLIKYMGPRANYLTCEHTLKWLRSQEYLWPRVSVRGPFAAWMAQGGRDTLALAREKAVELSEPEASPLGSRRIARLDEIIQSY